MPPRKMQKKSKHQPEHEEAVVEAIEYAQQDLGEYIVERRKRKKRVAVLDPLSDPVVVPSNPRGRLIGPVDLIPNIGLVKVKIEQDYVPISTVKSEADDVDSPQLDPIPIVPAQSEVNKVIILVKEDVKYEEDHVCKNTELIQPKIEPNETNSSPVEERHIPITDNKIEVCSAQKLTENKPRVSEVARDTENEGIEGREDPEKENMKMKMLQNIFSYLNHKEKLVARRVCSSWNKALQNWNEFRDNLTFVLRRSPAFNSYAVLKSSTAAWNKIELRKFLVSKKPDWYLPSCLNQTLTSLVLMEGTFSWSWILEFAGRFECLEKLAIINCERQLEESDIYPQTLEETPRFREFRQRIKSLKFETQDLQTLCFLFRLFTCDQSSLEQLIIIVPELDDKNTDTNFLSGFEYDRSLLNLIVSCSTVIESLAITVRPELASTFCTFLLDFDFDRKIELSNLVAFRFKCYYLETHLSEPDQKILSRFVATLKNLQFLAVPKIYSDSKGFQRYDSVTSMPENIVCIDLCEGFSEGMLERMTKLRRICMHQVEDRQLFKGIMRLDTDKVYPNIASLICSGRMTTVTTHIIIRHFPNLTKLDLRGIKGDPEDQKYHEFMLTNIIEDLPKLRMLGMSPSSLITDDGLGFWWGVSAALENCKSLRFEDPERYLSMLEAEKADINPKRSLSSLNLRELTMECDLNEISDLGIYYGLAFKDLRELHLHVGDELTDWGLNQLARLNPNMEKCHILTTSKLLSSAAIEQFQNSFHRIDPTGDPLVRVGDY